MRRRAEHGQRERATGTARMFATTSAKLMRWNVRQSTHAARHASATLTATPSVVFQRLRRGSGMRDYLQVGRAVMDDPWVADIQTQVILNSRQCISAAGGNLPSGATVECQAKRPCVQFCRWWVDCPLSRRSIQMSDQKFPRRTLLKGALLGVAAVPVSAAPLANGRCGRRQGRPERAAGEIARLRRGREEGRRKGEPELQAGPGLPELPAGADGQAGAAEVPCNIFAGRNVPRRAGARSTSSGRKPSLHGRIQFGTSNDGAPGKPGAPFLFTGHGAHPRFAGCDRSRASSLQPAVDPTREWRAHVWRHGGIAWAIPGSDGGIEPCE